jgi:preprotein translocase subunit SecA
MVGDWVKKMLVQIGIKEDEPLKNTMVSRRIRMAQQTYEGRAFGTVYAESAAEWLDKNCPELG